MLFMGATLLVNGTGKVCVSDIGHGSDDPTEAGNALVCVTDNTMCCRGVDSTSVGMGEWFINEMIVPGLFMSRNTKIYKNRGTGLVRLNVVAGNTLKQIGD